MSLKTYKIGKYKLEELNEKYYLDYYYIGSDKETVKYLSWGPLESPSEALLAFRKFFNVRPQQGLPMGYAITYRNVMIGIIDYHTLYDNGKTAEVGFVLHRDFWGKGIMTMALKKVIEIGFNDLGYDKIICGHVVGNYASEKVIIKCGMKYEFEKIESFKGESKLCKFYSTYRYN